MNEWVYMSNVCRGRRKLFKDLEKMLGNGAVDDYILRTKWM